MLKFHKMDFKLFRENFIIFSLIAYYFTKVYIRHFIYLFTIKFCDFWR